MDETTPTPTGFLAVTGHGKPEAIDAYMYGDNGRAITVANEKGFVAIVTCFTDGGFRPEVQADRLASGLYGAYAFATFEEAVAKAVELAPFVGLTFAPLPR